MSRWILVDDTDSGINYVGPWFADKGSQDALGNYGPPYLSTLHGINSPGSFSYDFRGSQFIITITVQFPTVGNVTNPSAQCIIDGQVLGFFVYTNADNRVGLCRADGLDDSLHTITVRVDVSDDHTFWLDYVQYMPFPDTPLDTAAIMVENTDPQILLGGWTAKYPGYVTQLTDSTFSFQFYGISLTYVGFYDSGLPMDPTTATYSIDGRDPVPFTLDGTVAKVSGYKWSQPLFQTPQLEAKTHTLEIFYRGDSSKTPLSLSVLQIQNGTNSNPSTPTASHITTFPGNTGAPSSSSLANTVTSSGQSSSTSPAANVTSATSSITTVTPGITSIEESSSSSTFQSTTPVTTNTSLGSSDHNASERTTTPAIVGGVVGCMCLIILCIVGIIFLKRRRKSSSQEYNSIRPLGPTEEIIQPFPLSHASPSSISNPGPTLAPLRPLYRFPNPSTTNYSVTHSGNPSSTGLLSAPSSTSAASLSTTKHGLPSSPSFDTESSNQEPDLSLPLREVDSGVRFRRELSLLPPGYTAE